MNWNKKLFPVNTVISIKLIKGWYRLVIDSLEYHSFFIYIRGEVNMSRNNGNKSKGNKKEISGDMIIEMSKFLKEYYGIKYDWDAKLTHRIACLFMKEKENICLNKLSIQTVTTEDYLKNKVFFVKDESGKVVPYSNPCYKIGKLLNELCPEEETLIECLIRKIELQEKRLAILNEQGYTYDPCTGEVVLISDLEIREDNIISIEEWKKHVTERQNRQEYQDRLYKKTKQKVRESRSFKNDRRQAMKRG